MSFADLDLPSAMAPALSHNVVDVLREMIARGQLEPGAHLKEAEIATALGVSRGPVREAFVALENDGYIELRRHRGAYVRELTRRDIVEVHTLRFALERLAVERASAALRPEDVAALDAVLARMKAITTAPEPADAVALDLAFHDAIFAAADHERLGRSWKFIRGQVSFFLQARNVSHPDFHRVGYKEHKELRDVLVQGDAEKTVAMLQEHIAGAYQRLLADHPEESEARASSTAG
jgi:DNA-binding GntR family transcriptional regulator